MHFFERVFEGVIELVHFAIISPLLQIYLNSWSVKDISEFYPEATEQGYWILLTGVQNFEMILTLEDILDQLLHYWKEMGLLLLKVIDIDDEDMFFSGKTAADLDEIYITILTKFSL